MWEKDEGMMREEAKCLKIKAHFGETRGPISTEKCLRHAVARSTFTGVRRIRPEETHDGGVCHAKARPLHILFSHYTTRLLIHKAYVGSCDF